MSRRLIAAAWVLTLAAALAPHVSAAPVFAKTAHGQVLSNHLDLALAPVAPCDETTAAIPDGSRLVSDHFLVQKDANGIGVFAGPARLVRPDGSLILVTRLHGTIGLGDGKNPAGPCREPGHLEGWLDAAPIAIGHRNVSDAALPQVHFSADEAPVPAGAPPLYLGTMLGLLEVPAPKVAVTVSTDRRVYPARDSITFSVRNDGHADLAAMNGRTDCTIIQLQRRVNTGWQDIGRCDSLVAMPPVPLKPGEDVKAVLAGDASRAPGEYRGVASVVRMDSNGKWVSAGMFASPIFVITTENTALSVTPSQRGYGPRQPIVAVVRNGQSAVTVMNGESFCTTVQLQRDEQNGWVQVSPCPMAHPMPPADLKAHQTLIVVLPPISNGAPNWEPGRYRLAVIYRALDARDQPVGPEIVATSDPFPVGTVVQPLG